MSFDSESKRFLFFARFDHKAVANCVPGTPKYPPTTMEGIKLVYIPVSEGQYHKLRKVV